MKISAIFAASAVAVAASPALAEEEFCGQWNLTRTDDYIVYNDLWGFFADPTGTHARVSTVSTDPPSLSTRASAGQAPRRKSSPDGDAEYEIMVWLATIGGAGPLSNTGSAVAQVAVGGVDFELYHGKNGNITVYSFVAPTIVNSYSTDLKQFFDNLPANLTIAPTQYLINVQAGTEPFVGNGTLTVSKYSAAVKTAEYSQIQQHSPAVGIRSPKMKFLLVAAAFAASAVSADKMCGDWDTAVVGDFTLYNNLWGKDNDPGTGHQCTTLLNSSADNSTLVWSTEYKWGGITWNVKGYPNVGLHFKPIELANVDSIPTSINYTYEYTPTTTANVAYDLFTSSTPDGDFEYEIMVWLAAIGTAWPLASEGKNIKNITVSGVDFMLNHGVNGNMTVFSYVAAQLTKNFTGDLTEFIEALPQDVAPDAKQYLTKVQCGTESYHADNASMTVTSYTVAVNTLMQGDVGFSQN
ncbi:hypothetical protein ON010_g8771 [Phytophthora cinnamomi]|nr:hypothetical protein ON010_g8771 [Phytophthora cinnamomi]